MDNILFIFTDQWQANLTGYRGHKIVKTPNLDKLAKKSVDFTNSFTVCPLCTPARGSLFTGLYPHQSGVIDNCDVGGSRQDYLPKEAYTWLDASIDKGYKVGHFGKWHLGLDWQENKENIEFDIMRIESDREKHNTRIPNAPVTERGQIRHDRKPQFESKKTEDRLPFYGKLASIEERFEYSVTNRSLEFMETHKENPWCLTVSLVGPHFPNVLPEPYFSMYQDADLKLPENFADRFINKPWFQSRHWWPSVNADDFDENEWRKAISAYYGSITLMDNFIGKLLKKAEKCSGGRKTRVIFTADHGEMIGSHSRFDKSAYFYEEVLRTPLLVCDDLCGEQKGFSRDEFVNTLDISRTFFDLAGKTTQNGRSLMPLLDENTKTNNEKISFVNYYKYNGHSFEIRGIKTERYKYSFIPQDIDELYDLENDPYEMTNLADNAKYLDIVSELKEKVLDNMKANGDYLLEILDNLPNAGSLTKPDYPKLKLNY